MSKRTTGKAKQTFYFCAHGLCAVRIAAGRFCSKHKEKRPRAKFERWTTNDAHCVRYDRGPWFLHVCLDHNGHDCEPAQRIAEVVAKALNRHRITLPTKGKS